MSIWQLPSWFGWLLAAMVGMIVLAAGWLGGLPVRLDAP